MADSLTAGWFRDLKEAQAVSKENNLPLMVDVFSVWCSYCKILHNDIYPSPTIKELSKRFVTVHVNGERNRDFMKSYDIKGFPAILFLDKNGYLLDRIDGMVTASRLEQRMRTVSTLGSIEESLQEQLAKNPKGLEANQRLALYYFELENYLAARRYFLTIYNSKSNLQPEMKREALFNSALSSMKLDEFKLALNYWNSFLGLVARHHHLYVYARFYRGMCQNYLGQIEQARQDLEFAARNLPDDEDRRSALKALAKLRRG